ncbi:MAG: alpha/beta fold hydrolase [Anaerolineales bacterium]|nr:alpha/beta fold hydrolase [Anaerolineales bacterium]
MRKLFVFVLLLGILSMACQTLMPTPTVTEPATIEAPIEVVPSNTSVLEALGGSDCEENVELTCVTLQVPLDHFDATNTETIDVVFGVLPASGERYGMFVQAFPGGPGGEGISSAYWSYFDQAVLEHYDIVYYDQRGLGLSNPLDCPVAYEKDFISYLTESDTAGKEGYDTPAEQEALIADTRTYVEECVAEIGIDPAKLAFFGTDQVAEDIESFRQAMGDDKFMLYGVSYGTAVGQTYAAAYPEHLSGLILDGTIDMTLNGEAGSFSQEKAFDKVLLAVLNACNEDELCAADMGGKDAVAVYDALAAKVSANPIAYEFPLASGEKAKGTFTFNQLEYTTAYQMYSLSGRMIFLKALASANKGDLVPILRLMYQNATIDPATYEYLGDATFSDTMFLSVLCTDDSFFSGTQEERIEQSIEAGQASNGTVPRLDGSAYTGVSCAFWPSSPPEVVEREALTLEGVPTFVLNAKLDPATPFEQGEAVYNNLADGYHIYAEGGVHSIFGWGYECPDQYVTDFLINGTLPSEHEIVCEDWGADATSVYVPNMKSKASEYADAMELFRAIDDNLYYLPEYYYGDASGDTAACTYGGTYTFGPSDAGETYTYDACSMIPGLSITGDGSYDGDKGILTFTVDVTGDKEGNVTYTMDYNTYIVTVTGEYDGETVDLSLQR